MTTSNPPHPLPAHGFGYLFEPGDRNPGGRHSPSRRAIYLASSESRRSASEAEAQKTAPTPVAESAPLGTATTQPA